MMIKNKLTLLLLVFVLLVISGCGPKKDPLREAFPRNDIYYELFVRSFADSDGDGIGDFQGLIAKLDYLESLGVTGLWLMPIHPSPSYHGYDVIDYYDVNPDYGTLDDFKQLLKETKKRGIKIMLDMVFNHSSDQHPWFKAALANDAQYRDYYTFATPTTNRSLLGSWGQNIWHHQDDQYYVGYFSPSMPDLNFFNKEVHKEIAAISQFWLDLARHCIKNFWQSKGLDVSSCFQYDGSGLARENMFTVQFFNDVLLYMKTKSRNTDSFAMSLPKAGKEGTVRNLFKGKNLQENMFLKSGSMSRVQSYSGYIESGTHHYAVTVVVNNFLQSRAVVVKEIQEWLLDVMKTKK